MIVVLLAELVKGDIVNELQNAKLTEKRRVL